MAVVSWIERLWPWARWAPMERVRASALTRQALLYHSGRFLRRTGIALSLAGFVGAPLLTGSLREFWNEPIAPFGAMVVVSTREDTLLLCDRFVEVHVACDMNKLDPNLEIAYAPTPAYDWTKIWALTRNSALGAFGPASLVFVVWRVWRWSLQRLARRDLPAALAFARDLPQPSPTKPEGGPPRLA